MNDLLHDGEKGAYIFKGQVVVNGILDERL